MTPLIAALVLNPIALAGSGHACLLAPEGRIGELVEAAWQESEQAAAPPKQETAKEKRERERHEQDLKSDVEIGKKYAAEVEKEFKVSKQQAMIDRVNRIGDLLESVANSNRVRVTWGDSRLNKFDYHFKVVESKEVNAFSLPGGYIFVYEGLVKFAESDDELAGVLAHEIAHAAFRHVATLQRESQKFQLATLPAVLVAIFSGGQVGGDVLLLSQFLNIAKGSGWSQEAELASDYGSFQYLQQTSFSPVGMLTFIERLARAQSTLESIDWGIFRSHPPSRERAEALTKYLNEAKIPIRRSLVSPSARASAKALPDSSVEIVFDKRVVVRFGGPDAAARAEQAIVRLNEFFDTVPELYEVGYTTEGAIMGRREVLFRLTSDDAKAAKTSVDALTAETVKAMKRSIFYLAYRVWDAP
jgi:beta-barrel assembly-enhancing protease